MPELGCLVSPLYRPPAALYVSYGLHRAKRIDLDDAPPEIDDSEGLAQFTSLFLTKLVTSET